MMKNGEVWLVDFEPQVGQEIKKTRPAIIVNSNAIGSLPLKIVVPLTDGLNVQKPWMVKISPNKINGLKKISYADCFQLKSLSEKRFVKKLGILDDVEISEIKICMIEVLDLF